MNLLAKSYFNSTSLLVIIGSLLIFTNCHVTKKASLKPVSETKILRMKNIRNGDLIFVGAQTDHLSGAINRVTQTKSTENFDHIGLIEVTKDSIFVLHAAPRGGSQRENFTLFYKNQSEKNNSLVVYRLKQPFQHAISEGIRKAKTMLGKPYNVSYILNEEAYYCSDYVERAFREEGIFELEPMTFIDPATGKDDAYWVRFYKDLGIAIPNGELGCNPNGMAKSEKLIRIGRVKLNEKTIFTP